MVNIRLYRLCAILRSRSRITVGGSRSFEGVVGEVDVELTWYHIYP